MYFGAHVEIAQPVAEIKALSRGIEISRRYTLPGGGSDAAITSAKIGDTVQVHLQIVVPRYAALRRH